MIGKKITNPKKSASKSERIAALIEYVLNPATDNATEKCIYSGARGFFSGSPAGNILEMVALASEAVRSRDPVNHYVMSWQAGEVPTEQQIDEAVDIFLGELGLQGGHQVVYGLHADTDNLHLHLVVNRVHPDTCKPVEINKGFDIESVHRAVAKIEHAQGWRREVNARYQVLEDGGLGLVHERDPEAPRKPSTRARDAERRTGEKSAERVAIEEASPVLRQAQSWGELHRDLGRLGMRCERKGSGAILWVGDIPVKASTADRGASLSKLQRRLGPYQPAKEIKPDEYYHHTPKPDATAPRTLSGNVLRRLSECRLAKPGKGQGSARVLHLDARARGRPSDGLRRDDRRGTEAVNPALTWPAYNAARRVHFDAKAVAKAELDKRLAEGRKALADQQKAHRTEVLAGGWKGRGALLNAIRSALAAEQAGEKAALKEGQQRHRENFRKRFRPFPDFDSWRRNQNPGIPAAIFSGADEDGPATPPVPTDIRAFRPQVVGRQVRYVPTAGGGVAFVDTGRRIDVQDWQNRDATLAALQLAVQKWGRVLIDGNAEYMSLCCRIAVEEGIRIANPELLEVMERERAIRDFHLAANNWMHASSDIEQWMALRRFHDATQGIQLYGGRDLVEAVKKDLVRSIGRDQVTALLLAAQEMEAGLKAKKAGAPVPAPAVGLPTPTEQGGELGAPPGSKQAKAATEEEQEEQGGTPSP